MERIHYRDLVIGRRPDGSVYNARGEITDTTGLQARLVEQGQRTPIVVSEPGADGKRVLTQGHRRERAFAGLREAATKEWRDAIKRGDNDAAESWKEEADRWSYFWYVSSGVAFDDTQALIIDMDAGTVQQSVDPWHMGHAIRRRIQDDGFTIQQASELLGVSLEDAQAMLTLTLPSTAESVQAAVRSGTITLGTYKRKLLRMPTELQAEVMETATQRVEGNKRSHGVVSQAMVTDVIKSLAGRQQVPMFPDLEVVPRFAAAHEALYLAFDARADWTPQTEEMAEHWIGKILELIDRQTREIKQAA